jgi:hypothetical protein
MTVLTCYRLTWGGLIIVDNAGQTVTTESIDKFYCDCIDCRKAELYVQFNNEFYVCSMGMISVEDFLFEHNRSIKKGINI